MSAETPEEVGTIVQALRDWRRAHPRATFDEIETEVQRQFAPVQAQVVEELSHETPPATNPAEGAACCPQCQVPMQARGQRSRRVATRQGQAIVLQRAYYVCPACGAGHFPPG